VRSSVLSGGILLGLVVGAILGMFVWGALFVVLPGSRRDVLLWWLLGFAVGGAGLGAFGGLRAARAALHRRSTKTA
jgi:hypothetical protein